MRLNRLPVDSRRANRAYKALCLENARLRGCNRQLKAENKAVKAENKELEKIAFIDGLTGVMSRRMFDIRFREIVSAAVRYGRTFSVAMVDIDFFKQVNDKLGHQAGDAALKRVAEILKKSLRECDLVARYGGEEFIIILDGTPFANAGIPLERLRAKIEEAALASGEPDRKLTASFGYTAFNPIAPQIIMSVDAKEALREMLIEKADLALYYSKNAGRNRVSSQI
jgi:diguanylate cyclase (GGDEF)-like protein